MNCSDEDLKIIRQCLKETTLPDSKLKIKSHGQQLEDYDEGIWTYLTVFEIDGQLLGYYEYCNSWDGPEYSEIFEVEQKQVTRYFEKQVDG